MKNYQVYAFYYKNGHKVDFFGWSYKTLNEAKAAAIEVQEHMEDIHVDINDMSPVWIRDKRAHQEWELDGDRHIGYCIHEVGR